MGEHVGSMNMGTYTRRDDSLPHQIRMSVKTDRKHFVLGCACGARLAEVPDSQWAAFDHWSVYDAHIEEVLGEQPAAIRA